MYCLLALLSFFLVILVESQPTSSNITRCTSLQNNISSTHCDNLTSPVTGRCSIHIRSTSPPEVCCECLFFQQQCPPPGIPTCYDYFANCANRSQIPSQCFNATYVEFRAINNITCTPNSEECFVEQQQLCRNTVDAVFGGPCITRSELISAQTELIYCRCAFFVATGAPTLPAPTLPPSVPTGAPSGGAPTVVTAAPIATPAPTSLAPTRAPTTSAPVLTSPPPTTRAPTPNPTPLPTPSPTSAPTLTPAPTSTNAPTRVPTASPELDLSALEILAIFLGVIVSLIVIGLVIATIVARNRTLNRAY